MRHLIESLQKKGKNVTPSAVAVESLFHSGGTVTASQAAAYLMEEKKKAREVAELRRWQRDREEKNSRASWNA